MKFYAPGGFHKENICCIQNSVGKQILSNLKMFHLLHYSQCRYLSCGIGNEADWHFTQREWDGTEWILAVRQSDREIYHTHTKKKVTPELVHIWFQEWTFSPGHTWLSLGLHASGSTLERKEKTRGSDANSPAPTPSGALLDTSLTVSTWPTFSHDSCFFLISLPLFLFGPVADLSSTSNML